MEQRSGAVAACEEPDLFSFAQIRPLAEIEMEYIRYVLDKCDGNKQKSAALLGINRKTIQRKLTEFPTTRSREAK